VEQPSSRVATMARGEGRLGLRVAGVTGTHMVAELVRTMASFSFNNAAHTSLNEKPL
jgi:hypothetical protein